MLTICIIQVQKEKSVFNTLNWILDRDVSLLSFLCTCTSFLCKDCCISFQMLYHMLNMCQTSPPSLFLFNKAALTFLGPVLITSQAYQNCVLYLHNFSATMKPCKVRAQFWHTQVLVNITLHKVVTVYIFQYFIQIFC